MIYRSALITGATSGIGAAFAAALPRETALLLTGRRADRLAEAAARLAPDGRQVATLVADLAAPSDRQALVARARDAAVDLVVCNAASARHGAFAGTPPAELRYTLEVNVVAHVELLHALLPGMCAAALAQGRRAGIVIVASMGAFHVGPELATYAASKAFLLRFGESLAAELRAEPVDVLTLCPSFTRTEFFARSGLPPPPAHAMSADAVAREALAALGRRPVHLCGGRLPGLRLLAAHSPQAAQSVKLLFARNPVLAVWRWHR